MGVVTAVTAVMPVVVGVAEADGDTAVVAGTAAVVWAAAVAVGVPAGEPPELPPQPRRTTAMPLRMMIVRPRLL
jgi:hypothetical protein